MPTQKSKHEQGNAASEREKPDVDEEDKATTEQPAPKSDKAKTEGTAAPPEPNE